MRRWQDLQKQKKPPKGKSHKGKKKRLPKDTDEEDNVDYSIDVEDAGGDEREGSTSTAGRRGRDDDEDGDAGDEGSESASRPAKRPRRQVKQTNPNLAEILAHEMLLDEQQPEARSAAAEEGQQATLLSVVLETMTRMAPLTDRGWNPKRRGAAEEERSNKTQKRTDKQRTRRATKKQLLPRHRQRRGDAGDQGEDQGGDPGGDRESEDEAEEPYEL